MGGATGIVRRAEERDIPAILDLLVQVCMVHHHARPDLFRGPATKYTEAELRELLHDEQRPVFVWEDGGKVRGHAFCVFQRHLHDHVLTDIKTLYIDDICVSETERGKQIGRRLYEHVLSFAREQGCYNVTLNVWAGNDAAMGFYQRMGLSPQKVGMEQIL